MSKNAGGNVGRSADVPKTNSTSCPSRHACQCTKDRPMEASLTIRLISKYKRMRQAEFPGLWPLGLQLAFVDGRID